VSFLSDEHYDAERGRRSQRRGAPPPSLRSYGGQVGRRSEAMARQDGFAGKSRVAPVAHLERYAGRLCMDMLYLAFMKADEMTAEKPAYPEQTCPFCKFQWNGPKARKSNQCPRCHKTIWHEMKERSIIEFQ